MARKPKRDHNGRLIPTGPVDGVAAEGFLKRDGELLLPRSIFGDELRPEVEAHIHSYRPRTSPWIELWPLIRIFVLRILLFIKPPTLDSAKDSTWAVTRFAGWSVQQGLKLTEEVVFQPLRVEEFVAGVAMSAISRRNLRSRLRAIGRQVTQKAPWPPEPVRLPRSERQRPYTATDLDLLERDIARQSPAVRRAAESVHHLVLGAGLRPTALRTVGAVHLVEVHGFWCLAIRRGDTVSYIPILAAHVSAVLDLASRYPDGPFVHPRAEELGIYKVLAGFKCGNSTPHPNAQRYRSNWFLEHLLWGTRLDLLVAAAGVRELYGLHELLRYLPPVSEAETIRRLAGGEA